MYFYLTIILYFLYTMLPTVIALASNTFYLFILLIVVAVVFFLTGKLLKYLFR